MTLMFMRRSGLQAARLQPCTLTSSLATLAALARVPPQTRHYHCSEPARDDSPNSKTNESQKPSNKSKEVDGQKKPASPPKMLKRDEEVLAKLLDREGGSAGVGTLGGVYEEGLGPQSKKNMFRLI